MKISGAVLGFVAASLVSAQGYNEGSVAGGTGRPGAAPTGGYGGAYPTGSGVGSGKAGAPPTGSPGEPSASPIGGADYCGPWGCTTSVVTATAIVTITE